MSIKNRIGSPSARRREHVRGRWNYRADLDVGNERTIHAAKQVIGFLIPGLMVSLPVFLATSRAATEIASWGLAALTLLYIGLDAFARHREFKFFRLGPDVALAACFAFGLLSVAASTVSSTTSSDLATVLLEGLGQLRWIPLLYLLVYAWELFPGLNRVMLALIGTVTVTAILTWIQHFQGVDWLTGEALKNAPTGLRPYFVPRGFFGSTEALATLFACVLPFPVAAACLRRDRDETDKMTWIGFGISVLIALALAFTYRPGFWWAGAAGAGALLLFPGDRRFKLLFSMALAIASVWFLLFVAFDTSSDRAAGDSSQASSPDVSLVERIEAEENARAEQHRIQMNRLVEVWEESPILGIAGGTAMLPLTGSPSDVTNETRGEFQYESVNVYFLILARGGLIGLILYLAFILHHLLNTMRLFHEIPESHHKHRVLVAGCFASQCAFHAAGLYWGTMTEAFSMNLFVLVCSMTLYMNEHYAHGIVSDDSAL